MCNRFLSSYLALQFLTVKHIQYYSFTTSQLHECTCMVPWHKTCSVEYTHLMCAMCVTYMDIPCNSHMWIFHVIYTHGYSMHAIYTRVLWPLLFNVCITSSNNLLNISHFTQSASISITHLQSLLASYYLKML